MLKPYSKSQKYYKWTSIDNIKLSEQFKISTKVDGVTFIVTEKYYLCQCYNWTYSACPCYIKLHKKDVFWLSGLHKFYKKHRGSPRHHTCINIVMTIAQSTYRWTIVSPKQSFLADLFILMPFLKKDMSVFMLPK